jgi:hypothetical protein
MTLRVLFASLVATAIACGGTSATSGATASGDTASPGFGDAGAKSGNQGACVAPDVLFALDRTLTMSRTPDGQPPDELASSKWALAIGAIRQVTAPPHDRGLRFGLELWPKREQGCLTLQERIGGADATNPSCEGGEILVSPDLDAGVAIASALDPEKTPICSSTPTGAALLGAGTELAAKRAPGKRQFVVLVTDGADWNKSCPNPNPLAVADQLAAAGVSTVVVGFSAEVSFASGVGVDFLNEMACAGQTAKGFPEPCTRSAGGWRTAPGPGVRPNLFYSATNAAELVRALDDFSASVCCDCVK